MTRWPAEPPSRKPPPQPPDPSRVTDDPLAALGLTTLQRERGRDKSQVYAVSRVNPLFNLPPAAGPEEIPRVHDRHSSVSSKDSSFSPWIRRPPSGCDSVERASSDGPKKDIGRFSSPSASEKSSSGAESASIRPIGYKNPKRKKYAREASIDSSRCCSEDSLEKRDKSTSSGYAGSTEMDRLRSAEEAGAILDRNPAFVKAIRIAGKGLRTSKTVPSSQQSSSSCSGGCNLTTIPEGQIDPSVPQPIWPGHATLLQPHAYDSIVDEALLLYTSLNSRHPHLEREQQNKLDNYFDLSVKDLLLDLLASINQTLENKTGNPEEMLKIINDKIQIKLEMLRKGTEEEMKKLCVNLSNNPKMNSVLRALSQSSSSGRSSDSSRLRAHSSSNDDDIYHIPSGSSSSGFSESPPGQRKGTAPLLPSIYGRKPSVFSQLSWDQEQPSTLSRGVRNALIYGTLGRQNLAPFNQHKKAVVEPKTAGKLEETVVQNSDKGRLNSFHCDKGLAEMRDEKPSVWQLYYGMKAEGEKRLGEGNPKDVPVFPGGRPEVDFTLDVPRSELLSKRLRDDKRWRFRCRVLTSFLGLVFFLLSVMAVSLMLTRGKRMFGSMV